MRLSLRPQHLSRYQQLARLLVRHGRSDLLRSTGLDAALDEEVPPEARARAEELADDLERMGPTFVKLGQLLSTRVDLLPAPYTEALSRLQDRLEPFPYADVERIVGTELGVRLSKVYDDFDPQPLAAASLGQVHRATLRGGRDVVVKVQRPGVREQVFDDLDVLGELSDFLDAHTERAQQFALGDLLAQFRRSLLDELDYRREAANLVRLGRILQGRPRLVVPRPYDDFTTGRVLTMQFVAGRKVTDLSPLAWLDLDGAALADELFRAYLDQVLVEGFFHADPHPGNVLVTPDGRLGLVDVGMVAHVPTAMRGELVKLLLALGEQRGEEVARLARDLGTRLPTYDNDGFTREVVGLVERHADDALGQLDAGALVLELARTSGDNGLRPPPEFAMLGKALLNLDQIARTLDADFRPNDALRRHTVEIMRSSVRLSPGGAFAAMLETKDFVEQLPGRLNRVVDTLSSGRFEVAVQAFDEPEMHRQLHKMANRVASGLVLAALIVGAAMLSRVPSATKVFGYPAVAFVFFVIAALGGFALLLSIILSDRRISRRTRGRP